MKRILKYALWTVGAALLLAAGAVAYIVATFDPNAYKPQIIQAVQDKTQRRLQLDGEIALHLFPSISLSLGGVTLSERQSKQEFAAIGSLGVSLKLLPLLSRQVVVDEIVASGIKARIVKYKNGKTNIDDLMSAQTAPAAAPPAEPVPASVPLQFDVAAVNLSQVALIYRDEMRGAVYELRDLSLKTGRIASGLPVAIELAAHALANQPRLDIVAKLKANLSFDLDANVYRIRGLDLQASGAALDITELSLQASGAGNAKLVEQEYGLDSFILTLSGYQDGSRFKARVELPELGYGKHRLSGKGIALAAKFNGAEGDIEAMLSMPAVEGNARAFKAGAVSLEASLTQPQQQFKMKLTTPLTGSVELQQCNLSDLKLALNASGEQIPGKRLEGELKGSLQADLQRQSLQGGLAGSLMQSQIKLKAAVNDFSMPRIRYDLDMDKLDVDPYLPPRPVGTKESGKTRAEPERPFDLAALKNLNLEGGLRIGSLKGANIKAAQVRVDMKARAGILSIAPFSAKLYQGSLDGKATLDAHSSSFGIGGKLSGIDIAPLLKDMLDLELVEGRGNISFDLSSHGNTVTGLKRALGGTAGVNLADGAVRGVNLAKLVQGVQSLGKDSSTQTLGVDKNEKTSFSEFKASFRIRNGVAHNDDLAVKSTVLRLGGSGDIDIGRDSLNYNAKAIFAKTEQGRTATLPVTVYGAFDDLKFKVDYSALLADLARQKLDEKKEELKARAQEELKARAQEELKRGLKNLFR